MTASTLPAARPATLLSRTRIELRKLLDTRSAVVLLSVTGGLLAAMFALVGVLGLEEGDGLREAVANGAMPLVYLLPIIGLLAMTAEWRFGTALWTYALDPRRSQVFTAKLLAVAVLVVVAVPLAVLLGITLLAVLGEPMPDLREVALVTRDAALGLGLMTLVGVSLGAALLNPPLAIVLLLLAPQIVPQLLMLSERGAELVPYLNLQGLVLGAMVGADPPEARHLVAVVGLWVVLPLVIGLVRNARQDA